MQDQVTVLLTEMRNWVRVATYTSVRKQLEDALPDMQSRTAYQLLDGVLSLDQVRVKAKMSPNKLVALTQRWSSMGLMEATEDKRRKRLFDLKDFNLLPIEE